MKRGALGLCGILVLLSGPVGAGPFCVTDFAGKRCWFQNLESCLQAAGNHGTCEVNREAMRAPQGDNPFCMVESWQTDCTYATLESCRLKAQPRRAACIANPNHVARKMEEGIDGRQGSPATIPRPRPGDERLPLSREWPSSP
ncbi:MAG: DUF3551 domain-containing protein [Magnetococcales bacterium]|nr:DUF3551 domain-containing protein [Magnetococcales bacterium]